MNATAAPGDFPWKRSRFGFAVTFFWSLLVMCTLLRLVLLIQFGPPGHRSAVTVIQLLFIGFRQDFFVALAGTLPLLFWIWIIKDRTFARGWHRIPFVAGFSVFWIIQVFLFFTEYYFFDEFRSRFNTVAVDYLLYPREVAGNIWDAYPVALIVLICVGFSLAWNVIAFRYYRQMWYQPSTARARFLHFALAFVLCALLWLSLSPRAGILPASDLNSIRAWITARTDGTRFSNDRTLNEIANNGVLSFFNAALTRNLDYSAFYRTLPRDEAYTRARRLLTSPNAAFVGGPESLRRHVAGDASRPKLNVVIILEESLGSEFWGSLGNTNRLTPEMDKLALNEGLFFTNIYACGNRTVRGFEGALSSFPPLPGDSIVKRDRSDNVESIARVLKRDGYDTLFLYGGRGLFDNMRSYALGNGWDRFIEQKDFAHPTFTTRWGVCDEDVFNRALEEFRALHNLGKPFLGTIMSVSNHQPYTFPKGRITEDRNVPKPNRSQAVKYSDWCLGDFFRKAKKEAFWTNTVFVVIADHGARVYGSQAIPIFSYEIPWVILGPAAVKEPQRVGTLGSSLDVPPTVLGLIGRPYESLFFGRDLLREPAAGARATINHNRDIGMFAQERMVVLGLQKTIEYYAGDPKVTDLKRVARPTPEFLELEKDTTALFQVADDLYMHRLFRIDGMPSPTGAVATAESPTHEER